MSDVQCPHRIMLKYADSIDLNANDFFDINCAYSMTFDSANFKWMIPIIEKYEDAGLNAIMSFVDGRLPLLSYQSENFKLALAELKTTNPTIYT